MATSVETTAELIGRDYATMIRGAPFARELFVDIVRDRVVLYLLVETTEPEESDQFYEAAANLIRKHIDHEVRFHVIHPRHYLPQVVIHEDIIPPRAISIPLEM